MDNPNWTEITSANTAVCTAVGSWIAAIATIGAGIALKFAKKAAKAAGEQVDAALAAAKSAREQVDLMRQEMEWNEPQPIFLLAMDLEVMSPKPLAWS